MCTEINGTPPTSVQCALSECLKQQKINGTPSTTVHRVYKIFKSFLSYLLWMCPRLKTFHCSNNTLIINYWDPIRLLCIEYLKYLKLSFLPSLNVSKTENVSFFQWYPNYKLLEPHPTIVHRVSKNNKLMAHLQPLCTEYLEYLKAFFSYLLWMCPRLKMFHLKLLAWVDLRNPLQFRRQCRR